MKINKNITLYLIYSFLSVLSFFTPYINLYFKEVKHMSLSSIGSVILTYQITKFLFEVPTGVISDKYGRKASAIIGYIFIIISYAMLFVDNIMLIYISFFVKGIGFTFISGSLEAIFVESIKPNKLSKISSIKSVFFFFGFGVSAIIGGFLIERLTYVSIIIIDIVIMILVLTLVMFISDKNYAEKNIQKNKSYLISSIKLAMSNKIIMYFLIVDFIIAFSFISIENFYSTFLTNKGISLQTTGIIIAMQLFISSLVGAFIHNVFKNMNKNFMYTIFSLLRIGLIIPIYMFNLNIFSIAILYILGQICFSIFSPIRYEIVQGNIENDLRATLISIRSLMISLGGISSYLLISLLGKRFDLNKITLILLICTFICYVVINIKLLPHIKNFYRNSINKV